MSAPTDVPDTLPIAQPETVDGEVLIPLDRPAAEKLDGRIRRMAGATREHFEKVGRLLDDARAGQVHDVLGFPSWPTYVADALGGNLQLSGDSRREIVALMSDAGMSVRGISAATGVPKSTVADDVAKVSLAEQVSENRTPDPDADGRIGPAPDPVDPFGANVDDDPEPPTTGTDGKTYPRKPKKPKKLAPSDSERRAAFRNDMSRKADAAAVAVEKLYWLATRDGGDPFADYSRRKTVAAANVRKQLVHSIDYLRTLLDQLPEPSKGSVDHG
ncbi:winged helix-turn-helix domain-containing protein [Mycobacterium sp.]|uniref:winged helix-turn-helix domain-containing protein n=1 Tax=Mycobacterium sp. TaxID=1785 RepID=UPI003D6AD75B